jgi:hypothetical protein
VGDDGGILEAGLLDDAGEPAGEAVGVETVERRRLAEAGDVGCDNSMVTGELWKHGSPHGAATLDAPVEQQQRWAVTDLDDGGGHARDIDRA